MEPGFFLGVAESTRDKFSYHILPVKTYDEILTRGNPTVLVRCVVQPCGLNSSNSPIVKWGNNTFYFHNAKNKELFSEVETKFNDDTKLSDAPPVDYNKKMEKFHSTFGSSEEFDENYSTLCGLLPKLETISEEDEDLDIPETVPITQEDDGISENTENQETLGSSKSLHNLTSQVKSMTNECENDIKFDAITSYYYLYGILEL